MLLAARFFLGFVVFFFAPPSLEGDFGLPSRMSLPKAISRTSQVNDMAEAMKAEIQMKMKIL